MIRTAIYCRVSTDKQFAEGDSVAAQLSALHEYINAHKDHVCVGEYIDGGSSGTKIDRDELQKLLQDVQNGKIDKIIFTKLDRWFRSIRHYINTQEILDKYNVSWLAIWEPIYDSSTPQGRLIINQLMSIAQFEAENTGQRVRQVVNYKIQNGEFLSGNPPLGYKVENKHLVPDDNADFVRSVFEFYNRTGSLYQTADYMSDNGIHYRSTSVKQLLRNRKYIGEHRGNTAYCEPLIDRSLFDSVQRQLGRNVKKSQKRTYIFSGLLVCQDCGSKMAARVHSGSRAYRCPKHFTPPHSCPNGKTMFETTLEKDLLPRIRPQMEKVIKETENIEARRADHKKKLANLQKKIDKLKDLYLNDLIDLEEYKRDKESYLEQIAELEAADNTPETNAEAARQLLATDFEKSYTEWSDADKRRFWRGILKAVYFNRDRVIDPDFLL